jgi:type IV secretory pathway TraG/TraD family ATPase VirD4
VDHHPAVLVFQVKDLPAAEILAVVLADQGAAQMPLEALETQAQHRLALAALANLRRYLERRQHTAAAAAAAEMAIRSLGVQADQAAAAAAAEAVDATERLAPQILAAAAARQDFKVDRLEALAQADLE